MERRIFRRYCNLSKTVSPDNNQLLSDYAKRFHQIKTPRKLLWKKNLGTVKVGKTDLVNGYYENISWYVKWV